MATLTKSQQKRLFWIRLIVKIKMKKTVEKLKKWTYNDDSILTGTIEKLERNLRG